VLPLRVQVVDDDKQVHGRNLKSHGPAVQKGNWLRFEMIFNVPSNLALYWQVTNTGDDADKNNDMRGEWIQGKWLHFEEMKYSGTHMIEVAQIDEARKTIMAVSERFYYSVI